MTLQEIINQVNDYVAHYTTGGSIELEQKIRAINRAIEYVKARIGMFVDERFYVFRVFPDKKYYDLPPDFREPIALLFDDENKNVPSNEFFYQSPLSLMKTTGFFTFKNVYSIVYHNRKKQLLVSLNNPGFKGLVESFSKLDGITVEEDADNPNIDNTNLALNFDIILSKSASQRAVIKKSFPSPMNWKPYFDNNSAFKVSVYLPSDKFTSIDFVFGSSSSDYWRISTNTDWNGNVFKVNTWNELVWYLSDIIVLGNPNPQNITYFKVIFNEETSLISDVYGVKLKNLYVLTPINLKLIYYSLYKGTDSSGTNNKVFLDNPDDIVNFGDDAPELINVVALKAATYLIPQLRKDPQFWSLYKTECEEVLREFARSNPRKRAINYGSVRFLR